MLTCHRISELPLFIEIIPKFFQSLGKLDALRVIVALWICYYVFQAHFHVFEKNLYRLNVFSRSPEFILYRNIDRPIKSSTTNNERDSIDKVCFHFAIVFACKSDVGKELSIINITQDRVTRCAPSGRFNLYAHINIHFVISAQLIFI